VKKEEETMWTMKGRVQKCASGLDEIKGELPKSKIPSQKSTKKPIISKVAITKYMM
jgi:hypothetical protein